MRNKFHSMFLLCFSGMVMSNQTFATDVDCNAGAPGILSSTIADSPPGTSIFVTGTCHESVLIDKDDITLVGDTTENKAVISGFFPQDRFVVDGAQRVKIIGFVVEKGVFGIRSRNNASFSLTDIDVNSNFFGVEFDKGSMVSLSGEINIASSEVFGLQALTGSKIFLEENAHLSIMDNFLGAQISINSTLFANTGSKISVMNNDTIGFSVNTGATAMLFNANLHTKGNGLDGLDVVSHSNFEVDGESTIISESNGREGISVDNSTLNLFGFFSSKPGLPRIVSHANTKNGILVESTSKLDIGRNSSIHTHHNNEAGIRLDDGSSAVIQRAELHSNNGTLPRNNDHQNDRDMNGNRPADVVVTFGSRISFNQEADESGNPISNMVGLALCDHTSLSRGDIHCKR